MRERFARLGDVQAGIDDAVCDLRVLLEWVEREESKGVGEAPYPPNFPKMPGEPPRVQPSRAQEAAGRGRLAPEHGSSRERRLGTESAQTRADFSGSVGFEGGGTAPHPRRAGARACI